MLENYTATYTATAAQKLIDQGAVFLGRTNMDEFAMGSSTEHSAFGPTKNPHDLERVPGGSSGGSAAAVAADMACAALGSDTGGSIRQPAALCGCVGFKPTYGAVSRHGLMAMGSSFDQIGPLTKTVGDAQILFEATCGQDLLDSTSIGEKDYEQQKQQGIIGIPKGIDSNDSLHNGVRKTFQEAVQQMKDAGVDVREIDLPSPDEALATYYVVIPAEVSSNMARYDGMRYGLHVSGEDLLDDYVKTRGDGLGAEVKRRIMLGTFVLSAGYYDAYYNNAQRVRAALRKQYEAIFSEVDALMTPTVAHPAFRIGEKVNDPVSMYLEDVFTVTANLVGIPALSVSAGTIEVDGSQLPLGVQFMVGHGQERILFDVGKRFANEL